MHIFATYLEYLATNDFIILTTGQYHVPGMYLYAGHFPREQAHAPHIMLAQRLHLLRSEKVRTQNRCLVVSFCLRRLLQGHGEAQSGWGAVTRPNCCIAGWQSNFGDDFMQTTMRKDNQVGSPCEACKATSNELLVWYAVKPTHTPTPKERAHHAIRYMERIALLRTYYALLVSRTNKTNGRLVLLSPSPLRLNNYYCVFYT